MSNGGYMWEHMRCICVSICIVTYARAYVWAWNEGDGQDGEVMIRLSTIRFF